MTHLPHRHRESFTPSLPVKIFSHDDPSHFIVGLAMIDAQSTGSFVDERVLSRLGVQSERLTPVSFRLTTLGQFDTNVISHSVSGLCVQSLAGDRPVINLPPAVIHPRLPDASMEVATQSKVNSFAHLRHLAGHFPERIDNLETLLLIGVDCGQAMTTHVHGEASPWAHETPLGFALIGSSDRHPSAPPRMLGPGNAQGLQAPSPQCGRGSLSNGHNSVQNHAPPTFPPLAAENAGSFLHHIASPGDVVSGQCVNRVSDPHLSNVVQSVLVPAHPSGPPSSAPFTPHMPGPAEQRSATLHSAGLLPLTFVAVPVPLPVDPNTASSQQSMSNSSHMSNLAWHNGQVVSHDTQPCPPVPSFQQVSPGFGNMVGPPSSSIFLAPGSVVHHEREREANDVSAMEVSISQVNSRGTPATTPGPPPLALVRQCAGSRQEGLL